NLRSPFTCKKLCGKSNCRRYNAILGAAARESFLAFFERVANQLTWRVLECGDQKFMWLGVLGSGQWSRNSEIEHCYPARQGSRTVQTRPCRSDTRPCFQQLPGPPPSRRRPPSRQFYLRPRRT